WPGRSTRPWQRRPAGRKPTMPATRRAYASERRTSWPGRPRWPGRIFGGWRLPSRARRRNDDQQMMSAVQQLAARYQQSPWRLKALGSAANRYLLLNRAEDYVPLYQAVYQDFPTAAPAALSHWKVTFQAYLHDRADASRLLREHVQQ